jgi:poly(A) polymerase
LTAYQAEAAMGLQELQQELTQNRILPALNSLLSCDRRCYLVGGAVRDALLNRLSRDYDFTTPFDPSDLARDLAKALDGAWFMLDAPRRQSRVVAGQGGDRCICDFAPFRDTNLEGDLQRRDFTINAMALPLQSDATLGALYDPLGGQNDLHCGRLRSCSAQVLFDDPLRVLKGLRHCLYMQLAIEPSTLIAMRHAAPRLTQVAPERIRSELAALFAFTPARRGLLWLQELDLIEQLFAVSAKTAAYDAGLSLLDRAEAWMAHLYGADTSHRLNDFFAQELEQGVSNAVAFKLAAWFYGQGVGDAQAMAVLQKLRCSRALQRAVSCLLGLDHRQAEELPKLPLASRSRALWAEDLGSHPQLAVCFLGLLQAAPFSETAQLLLPVLDDLQRCRVKGKVPNLVPGSWLQNVLQLRGAEVGCFLAALRREEIAGRVLNPLQAKQFLLQLQNSGRRKND